MFKIFIDGSIGKYANTTLSFLIINILPLKHDFLLPAIILINIHVNPYKYHKIILHINPKALYPFPPKTNKKIQSSPLFFKIGAFVASAILFRKLYYLMGCVNNGELKSPQDLLNKTTLTVATLNYCGIMNSPFEFYCEEFENQLKDISGIFLSLLPKYIPNFAKDTFKWELGKIDVKLRIGRYSPMFTPEVGVQQGKFLNRSEFQTKWEEVFTAQARKINLQAKKNEKETTRLYDFITYHTLLKYVFKVETVEQALSKDTEVYLKTIRPFYELSFLNEQRKVKKMVDNFAKLQCDIFFFQQYSDFFYNYLINRREHIIAVDSSKDTMIIAKEASFEKKKDIQLILRGLSKEQRDNLNSSETNAFLCVDNYILISSHLSSKADKNKLQIEKLKVGLADLKKHLPDYDIILGGDLNSFLPPFSKEFYFYPDSENQLTTIKKRTMTQGQFHKAEKIVEQSKDKIISTLKIDYASTMYINGRVPMKQNYVPSNEHPFDHFVVVAKIHKRSKN